MKMLMNFRQLRSGDFAFYSRSEGAARAGEAVHEPAQWSDGCLQEHWRLTHNTRALSAFITNDTRALNFAPSGGGISKILLYNTRIMLDLGRLRGLFCVVASTGVLAAPAGFFGAPAGALLFGPRPMTPGP